MSLFKISQGYTKAEAQARQSEELRKEGDRFELATDGGYIKALKYALFVLFGYYNARLFIVTVPGWEGYLTAVFALAGEATALYCIANFNRSAGQHKTALGVFGLLLTAFSVTHATISWFRLESHSELSRPIQYYCETVAFPLLFGLLLLAAVVIPLMHWRRKIADEQAKAKVEIEAGRARLVAESANIRAETELERQRLESMEERVQLGNEFVERLRQFVNMKKSEQQVLASIADPVLRRQVETAFGLEAATAQDEKRITGLSPSSRAVLSHIQGQQDDQSGK